MMYKKRTFLTLFTLLFLSLTINSQERTSRKKIKVLKVAFITEKLDLSEKEAVKFWPIYNKFEKIRSRLYYTEKFKLKKQVDKLGGIDNMQESDAKLIANKMLTIEKSIYQSHLDFQKEMSSIISYKKMVKLQIIEREFNRKLFNRYKKKRKKGTK